jgi:hypothetical protein
VAEYLVQRERGYRWIEPRNVLSDGVLEGKLPLGGESCDSCRGKHFRRGP